MACWLQKVELRIDSAKAMGFAKLDDFFFKDEPQAIEDIAEFLVSFGKLYSVMSVDFEKKLLVLVKTVEGVDIKIHPFLYTAQRKYGVEVVGIPFSELDKVERAVSSRVSHIKTIFLHSTGRCGSTLLCKALEKVSTVQAISEPDAYSFVACAAIESQFKEFFPGAEMPSRETLVQITRVSTLLLNFYFQYLAPDRRTICYKVKSHVIDAAEIMQSAIPDAKNIYIYRNCFSYTEGWVRLFYQEKYWFYWLFSAMRLDGWYLRNTFGRLLRAFYRYYFGNTEEYSSAPYSHGCNWCFGYFWRGNVERAVSLIKKDPTNFFHAILRYEDLCVRKEHLVLSVAQALGVAGTEGKELPAISEVFKSNSQADSAYESKRNREDTSDVWFGEWERRQINAVLDYLGGEVGHGDYVVPGTI